MGVQPPHYLGRRCSPVPSRLKGIETFSAVSATTVGVSGSPVPSRLKGIETLSRLPLSLQLWLFTRAFPFEGN